METKSLTVSGLISRFLTKGHERSVRARKNIVISFISKGVSILTGFLIVPLTLGYVGKLEYGIWMTLSSIIHWFTFFDIGLGNGLRNKLAEALALNDTKTARIYISSAFALILGIAAFLFIGFAVAAQFVSWNTVFNTSEISNDYLLRTVIAVFFLFCTGFVMNVLSSILQAMQKYWVRDVISICIQFFGLAVIYILVKTTDGSLFNLCLFYAGKSPLVMLIAAVILFSGTLKYLRPKISFIHFRAAMPLLNLGFMFFINQILYLVASRSSLFIVAQFYGPEEVTVFNLAVKYMTIGTMMYMMVLVPYLSAFTEAYTKKEFGWIRSTLNKIQKIWLLASVVTISLIFLNKFFFHIWVGDKVTAPLPLIIALACSGIIHTFYNKYTLFFNGIGKIRLQFWLLLFQALFFIPLSYMFFKLKFGLVSLVAAQILLYAVTAVFSYIQYRKIITDTATGVWFK